MAESSDVLTDAKAGLGMPLTVLGVFFFVQAYGYARGAGIDPPASIAEAVTRGMIHLPHLVTPWSDVAWPLTPSLCGFLLLYCAVLPDQLPAAKNDERTAATNRRFFAALVVVVVSAMLAGVAMWRPSLVEFVARSRTSYLGFGQPIVYAACVAGGFFFVNWCLRFLFPKKTAWVSPRAPWPRLIPVVSISLLYMVAFIGSEFDGRMDAVTGAVPM